MASSILKTFPAVFWIYLIGSFLLVAFGQPSSIPFLGILSGAVGFGCFWKAMQTWERPRDRFCLSLGWFALVHGVQLSWFTTMDYMGPFILVVFLILTLGVGVQFGILSLWITPYRPISWRQAFAMAGTWTLFEWSRLFFLSGYTWNPVGLALANSTYSLQLASLCGIFGLSFWVILSNLLVLNVNNRKTLAVFGAVALFPYLFGFVYEKWVDTQFSPSQNLSVALIQTALLPDQKDYDPETPEEFIPPLNQWEQVLNLLDSNQKVDLIVFPEAAFPFGAFRPYCDFSAVKEMWEYEFGEEALADLPPLSRPFSSLRKGEWKVTNAFIAQAIANHFKARVIIGLDDQDRELKYNAAFHFQPHLHPERCEKRVLVPAGEYVPLQNWAIISGFLAKQFGIHSSFSPGIDARVFQHPEIPIGVSICSEETFSGLTRQLRQKGAELLVNVSNDAWFPHSKLPQQHFQHGRIRSVENGVPAIRSCNWGIVSGVDCLGRTVALKEPTEEKADILYLSIPLQSVPTLYSWWGEGAILGISSASLLFYFFRRKNVINCSK